MIFICLYTGGIQAACEPVHQGINLREALVSKNDFC